MSAAPLDAAPRVRLLDLHPPADRLREDVVRGLGAPRKKLPPKYFYDDLGARLFERITELDAYYPTRTELGILQRHLPEMASALGERVHLVEFGSGSGEKTRMLLERLIAPVAYTPIDIARRQLVAFAGSVADAFPDLEVLPVCADYTRELSLPRPDPPADRIAAFFPGSTIGNFEPDDSERFLRRIAALCGAGGRLLIGIDRKKDVEVLERAYNDQAGVTAAFNLNLLARINRECGADFDLQAFRHRAVYDAEAGRIEMRLISQAEQTVRIPAADGELEAVIRFAEHEHIVTEYSHKYDLDGFGALAGRAGWHVVRTWSDEREWFSVLLLEVRR